MDVSELVAEAIPLIAEDLRNARKNLGITTARAARRANISDIRYRQLEGGRVVASKEVVQSLISVARALGLEALRFSYVDETQQYMNINISEEDKFTIFVDSLTSNIAELGSMGHFVSPQNIFALVDEIGLDSILACRNTIDKRILELWVAAVFSLGLDSRHRDCFVRPVSEEAPDVEILVSDCETHTLDMIKVEVTQYSKYSKNMYEIIQKKLEKRYDRDTVVVVLVDRKERIFMGDLHQFIKSNNSENRQIYLLGGTGDETRIKVVACREIKFNSDDIGWVEAEVNLCNGKQTRRKYDGIVIEVPFMKGLYHPYPVYVKKVNLSR